MKKFALALSLMIASSQSFAVAAFLAGLHDKYIALGQEEAQKPPARIAQGRLHRMAAV